MIFWVVRVKVIHGEYLLGHNYSKFNAPFAERLYNILEQKGYNVNELELPYVSDYSWAYINFLQTSKVIVIPKLNLLSDASAHEHLSSFFDIPVLQVKVPTLIKKYGGAYNCMSWNIKG